MSDFKINNTPLVKGDTKYIVRGPVTTLIEKGIYKVGVNNANQRAGGVTQDKPLYASKLGTPVMADITFPSFDYTIDNVSYTVPEIKLYDVILVVDMAKNIVKTPVQGLNGTIKEYISDSDDSVSIKGRIVGKNGVHPFEEVNKLHQLISAPVAVKIVSKFLQNLNIDTIVIESAHIPQMEGGYSYQEFEITASTDFPIELNIVSASNTNTGTLAYTTTASF